MPAKEKVLTPGGLIGAIKDEVAAGAGIVPVIGSGMSTASGIPAGVDYEGYLFHCLKRVVDDKEAAPWQRDNFRWPSLTKVPVLKPNVHDAKLSWASALAQQLECSKDVHAKGAGQHNTTAQNAK